MERIFGVRNTARQSPEKAVDAGVEETLLQKRTMNNDTSVQAAKAVTGAGRPRQARTLLSQLQARDASTTISNERETRKASKVSSEDEPKDRKETEEKIQSFTSANRPVRSTRLQKPKTLAPEEVQYIRYSETHGLGPPWQQSLVYPEVGKKRVTVDFEDLKRLDEGELINDNLLEWYIRWLQEYFKGHEKMVYFFNTHFYTKLNNVPRGQRANSSINFEAVERWTAKDDIFSHDFVVVPINEDFHWYLAIICNLPNVQRKMEEDASEVAITNRYSGDDASSQPVELSEPARPEKAFNGDVEMATPDEVLNKQYSDLKLASSSPRPPAETLDKETELPTKTATGENTKNAPTLADSINKETVRPGLDSSSVIEPSSQLNESQGSGVFASATPASPEKKRKGKRKSGPPPRKWNTDQPMIVIIDSMSGGRLKTISNLKDYLVQEAKSKRGMKLDKTTFQGFQARKGIPQQNNYVDCGIYVCGYLHKFMMNPREFGLKLLSQDFDLETDWPEMKPEKMRASMRDLLMELAHEDQKSRDVKKAQKRANKRAAAAAASSSAAPSPTKEPAAVESNFVDLSSPAKPRETAKPELKTTRDLSPSKVPAPHKSSSASRQASPAKSRPATAKSDNDDEMLFSSVDGPSSPRRDLVKPLEEIVVKAQNDEERVLDQSQPEYYVPDSQSQGEKGEEFEIYKDESQKEV